MASRGSKRAAAQDLAGQPAAKKLPQGVAKSTFKAVVDILEHPMGHSIPENARQMLIAALPQSLCVPSDERHPHQAMVLEMVAKVIADVVKNMKTGIDAAAAHIQELDKSRPDLERQKSEAEAKLAAVLADIDAKTAASTAASHQVAEAVSLVSEKQKALKAADAPRKPAREEKERLETMLSTDFKALREPTEEWDAGKAKKCCNAIVSVAKKSSFEELLISSLSISLTRKPEERTHFDGMVLQQFEDAASEMVKQLAATLEAGSKSVADCISAVEAARSDLEKRNQVSEAAVAALAAAESGKGDISANLQAISVRLANFWPEMEKACAVPDAKTEELKNFQEYNVLCFEELRDRLSAKKSKELAEIEAKKNKELEELAKFEALKQRVESKELEAAAEQTGAQ